MALLSFMCAGGALGAAPARYEFKLPTKTAFLVELPRPELATPTTKLEWVTAWAEADRAAQREFGSRVALQLQPGAVLADLLAGRPLELARTVAPGLYILQAPDAPTAMAEAARLAGLSSVIACYPVMRRSLSLSGAYAPAPNDPHFAPLVSGVVGQWYLENRDPATGAARGVDINVRGAWSHTRGEGVTIAIADQGVELNHRDLAERTAGAPHHDFNDQSTNGLPFGRSASWAHGTLVAGLAAATGNNGFGMAGVAPSARLASWIILQTNQVLVSDEQLMDMYSFAGQAVAVQNHSWVSQGLQQKGPTVLEQAGLAKAFQEGRGGRGTIMVRAAGNDRSQGANANDDGYPADPRVISVAAVTREGPVASDSEPGACILVAAPGGDSVGNGLFSTDLTGGDGVNQIGFFPPFDYLWDFAYSSLGFRGTSAAAPLVSGMAALIVSANNNLSYRDVQQILLLSARHFDLSDWDLSTNGAGLRVSHNLGFGVPDAAAAVQLARRWSNRPPQTVVTLSSTEPATVPDDGLRLVVSGEGVPPGLGSIRTATGLGPHPDAPTVVAPLVDIGLATNASSIPDLTGKGALIQRGGATFAQKLNLAAQAGCAFAVVYNFSSTTSTFGCPGGQQLCTMGGTDFVPVPAVFIGYAEGLALAELFRTNAAARAHLRLQTTNYMFTVTNTLLCEHVGVRVKSDHPSRGDLRITLLSPHGTRSVLQRFNPDTSPGPIDWTYWSTHHFYESSVGPWTVEFSDESAGAIGAILSVELILTGVEVMDTDGDGLDDAWEQKHFGTLAAGPREDPDGDGSHNVREQIVGTDPRQVDDPLRLDITPWNATLARLSWPGRANQHYDVLAGTNVASLTSITNLSGRFPETEWFSPYTNWPYQFFELRPVSP